MNKYYAFAHCPVCLGVGSGQMGNKHPNTRSVSPPTLHQNVEGRDPEPEAQGHRHGDGGQALPGGEAEGRGARAQGEREAVGDTGEPPPPPPPPPINIIQT